MAGQNEIGFTLRVLDYIQPRYNTSPKTSETVSLGEATIGTMYQSSPQANPIPVEIRKCDVRVRKDTGIPVFIKYKSMSASNNFGDVSAYDNRARCINLISYQPLAELLFQECKAIAARKNITFGQANPGFISADYFQTMHNKSVNNNHGALNIGKKVTSKAEINNMPDSNKYIDSNTVPIENTTIGALKIKKNDIDTSNDEDEV